MVCCNSREIAWNDRQSQVGGVLSRNLTGSEPAGFERATDDHLLTRPTDFSLELLLYESVRALVLCVVKLAAENGGGKLDHGSGGIVLLRAA